MTGVQTCALPISERENLEGTGGPGLSWMSPQRSSVAGIIVSTERELRRNKRARVELDVATEK